MVSSCQLKAARALLGWNAIDLANASGVGSATIKRYEVQVGIPSGNSQNLFKLIKSLESAGIEFSGDPLNNPGVTLHLHKGHDND